MISVTRLAADACPTRCLHSPSMTRCRLQICTEPPGPPKVLNITDQHPEIMRIGSTGSVVLAV